MKTYLLISEKDGKSKTINSSPSRNLIRQNFSMYLNQLRNLGYSIGMKNYDFAIAEKTDGVSSKIYIYLSSQGL